MTSRPLTAGLWRVADGGVLLAVRVTTRAGADAVEGLATSADGSVRLAVKVRAVADRGAANRAVTAVLAKALGVAGGAVSIASGAASRMKTVHVIGDPQRIAARLEMLMGASITP